MRYISTRGDNDGLNAAQVIIKGLAPDGGLFVPEYIPEVRLDALIDCSYTELAGRIFALFLDGFSQAQINDCIAGAYNEQNFNHPILLHWCSSGTGCIFWSSGMGLPVRSRTWLCRCCPG